MSTLVYSAFQTSPTESFCGVLSKPCLCPHRPSTPGPICITQLPPIGASCSQQNLRSIPTEKLSKRKYERSRKAKNFPQVLQNISYPAPIPSSSAECKTKLLQESREIYGMRTTLPPSFWAKPSSAHRTAVLGKVHSFTNELKY